MNGRLRANHIVPPLENLGLLKGFREGKQTEPVIFDRPVWFLLDRFCEH
jgi:hypothetical protein